MKFTKRKDGRYQAKIYLGLDDERKPQYKYLYAASQKELERLYLDAKQKKAQGVNILSYDDSLESWIKKYHDYRVENSESNEVNVEWFRLKYFIERIGDLKIRNVDDDTIQSCIKKLYKFNPTTHKPTSKKTLVGYLSAISRVFKFAMAKRVTTYNPCEFVKIPDKAVSSKRRALSKEEQQMIYDTPHLMQTPAMIMMLTGLRRGEVTALTWDDINFVENTITVNKSYAFKECIIKEPKTESGYRTIPMPDKLIKHLKTVKKKSKYVCPNNSNGIMQEWDWQRYWNKYLEIIDDKYGSGKKRPKKLKKYDLPFLDISRFTPHYLRHTYATMLHHSGVPVTDAKFLLGHSDIQTTINIYTHLDEEKQKQSLNKLNGFLE